MIVLDLGDGENQINGAWQRAVHAALDVVEDAPGPRALVTTASGKFWSTGLDLDWVTANPELLPAFSDAMRRLYARLVAAPYVTVAAVQGHAFAAGAVLALAHDRIVMRADRGYLCLPEVDLGIPFPDGVVELIAARVEPRAAHEALITALRYGGHAALAGGLVDEVADAGEVFGACSRHARAHARLAGPELATIKQRRFRHALDALTQGEPIGA